MSIAAAIVKGASPSTLNALKERGLADILWKDKDGRMAVHYAASYGAVDALEWLAEQGADMDARQGDGANLLHAAAAEGQCGVIEWLHGKGEGQALQRLLTETLHDGQNAHQVALSNGHAKFARLLEDYLAQQVCCGAVGGGGGEGTSAVATVNEPPPPPPPSTTTTTTTTTAHHRAAAASGVVAVSVSSPSPPPPPETKMTQPPSPPGPPAIPNNTAQDTSTSTSSAAVGRGTTSSSSSASAATTTSQSPSSSSSSGGGGGFVVSAAWSVAGVGTCIQVTHRSYGLHVAFDMGTSAAEALGADHVFISHSHIDHIGALLSHARARSLLGGGGKAAKYYLPENSLAPLLRAKEAYEEMDDSTILGEFIAVKPGDVVRIHANIKAVVFATLHRLPSQGYALVREKSKGLKAEYQNLPPRELGLLRKQGVQVTVVEEVVEVAYTGDTMMEALLNQDMVRSARLLIMECTYLGGGGGKGGGGGGDGDVEAARKWQHIHLQDLVAHADSFLENECIVLCHVSRKYGPADRILRLLLHSSLPPSLLSRVGVTLAGFGRSEAVTSLEAELLASLSTTTTTG